MSLSLQERLDQMTPVQYEAAKALHALLAEVKRDPKTDKYDPVQMIEDIEFTLQQIWGFSRNRDYHTHWLWLEGCKCPAEDNAALFGAPYRITSAKCPHHTPEQPF